jgi:hypothetical protein
MGNSVKRFVAAVLTGGAAVGVSCVVSACGPAAASGPATPIQSTTATTSQTSRTTSAGAGRSTVTTSVVTQTVTQSSGASHGKALQFPNTQPFVRLIAYDPGQNVVEFRVVDRYTSSGTQDHFAYDPKDPGHHRLPLAATVSIDGIGGGDSDICPDAPGAHCTTAQLAAAVRDNPAPLVAQLVVDGNDRVTEVAEQLGVVVG